MKHFKHLYAAAAAAAISAASFATPVFATEGSTISIPSHAVTESGTLPGSDAQIDYAIQPATGYENAAAGSPYGKFNGIAEAGVTVTDPTLADNPATPNKAEFSDAVISVEHPANFPCPGEYVYDLSASVADNDAKNGLTASNQTYKVIVSVGYGANGTIQVLGYYLTTDGTTKVDEPEFVHTYEVHDLTVTKTVSGNQGNKNQNFDFTITITHPAGKTFNASGFASSTNETKTVTTYTGTLSDGNTFTIHGLTAEDIYTVEENKAGYIATATLDEAAEALQVTGEQASLNKKADGSDDAVVFNNEKDGTVPTGLLISAAPYVAVVGLGGVFAGMFFRKKRED